MIHTVWKSKIPHTTTAANEARASITPLALRAKEAARFVGLKKTAFYAAARDGAFVRVRLSGRQVAYTTASLKEWLESRPVIAARKQIEKAAA